MFISRIQFMMRSILSILILLPCLAFANVLSDIKSEAFSQLAADDSLLLNVMNTLALNYQKDKFSMTNSTICYDTITCTELEAAGVSNLVTASASQMNSTQIASITTGFIPLTSTVNCSVNNQTGRANIDPSGFSPCLTSNYPGHLALEVRFKQVGAMVTISGSLDNKHVLFLAIGPGANADYIIKSPALPTMDNIGGFQCLNAHGSAGDGMNNGGKLGSIQMQGVNQMLITYLPNGNRIGGFSQCLRP